MGSQASKTVVMESNSALRAEIGSANIVVYVSRSCPYCQTAMRDLTANGFDAKIVDANPSQRSALREMTGSSSVPNCWVKGQVFYVPHIIYLLKCYNLQPYFFFVGGCNDGPESWMGIAKMIKSGKLAELLKA